MPTTPGCQPSPETTMAPALACGRRRPRRRTGCGSRPPGGRGSAGRARARPRPRASLVLGEEQLERGVGAPHPAGGVDARARAGSRARARRLGRVDGGDLHQRAQPGLRVRDRAASPRGRSAGSRRAAGRRRRPWRAREVEVLVRLAGVAAARRAAAPPTSLSATPGRAQLGERVSPSAGCTTGQSGSSSPGGGGRSRPRPCRRRAAATSATEVIPQSTVTSRSVPARGEPLDRGRREAVAVVEAARESQAGRRRARAAPGPGWPWSRRRPRRSRRAPRSAPALEVSQDQLDGGRGARHSERVVPLVAGEEARAPPACRSRAGQDRRRDGGADAEPRQSARRRRRRGRGPSAGRAVHRPSCSPAPDGTALRAPAFRARRARPWSTPCARRASSRPDQDRARPIAAPGIGDQRPAQVGVVLAGDGSRDDEAEYDRTDAIARKAPTIPPQKRSGTNTVKCQMAIPIITQTSMLIGAPPVLLPRRWRFGLGFGASRWAVARGRGVAAAAVGGRGRRRLGRALGRRRPGRCGSAAAASGRRLGGGAVVVGAAVAVRVAARLARRRPRGPRGRRRAPPCAARGACAPAAAVALGRVGSAPRPACRRVGRHVTPPCSSA